MDWKKYWHNSFINTIYTNYHPEFKDIHKLMGLFEGYNINVDKILPKK